MFSAIVFAAVLAESGADQILEPTLDRAVDRADHELVSLLSASEAIRTREAAILAERSDLPPMIVERLRARLFERDFSVTLGSVPDRADLVLEVGAVPERDGGVLRVRCLRPELPAIVVRYLDKEWVDRVDPARRGPRGERLFAGRSGIEASSEDAVAAAFGDALTALRREVATGLSLDPGAGAAVIERVVSGPIIKGTFLRDSFVEADSRPYGAIYLGHVLLAVPEREMQKLGERVRADLARNRWTWVLRGGLLTLLGCGLFAAYVTADAWLRGTCSRLLKVVSAAALVAAALALLGIRL